MERLHCHIHFRAVVNIEVNVTYCQGTFPKMSDEDDGQQARRTCSKRYTRRHIHGGYTKYVAESEQDDQAWLPRIATDKDINVDNKQ